MFLTCGMPCSWEGAREHQGSTFLLGPPQLSCCCSIFGQDQVELAGAGAAGARAPLSCAGTSACPVRVRRVARYLCCVGSQTFPGGAL